jgi:hypothetical protein
MHNCNICMAPYLDVADDEVRRSFWDPVHKQHNWV